MKISRKQKMRLILTAFNLVLLVVLLVSPMRSKIGNILLAIGLILNMASLLVSFFDVKNHPEKDI